MGRNTVVLVFSEFGRRPRENASAGTDHGTAGPAFVLGSGVRGGLYGAPPSLTNLDDNGDLIHTTDFRSVYATLIREIFGADAVAFVRYDDFDTQYRMPAGQVANAQYNRNEWTYGITYLPIPTFALKADFQVRDDARAVDLANKYNFGIGFIF